MQKLIFFLLLAGLVRGVAQETSTISGQLVDVKTREGIAFATVTAYRAADTAMLAYKLSDDQGRFELARIPVGVPAYLVVAFTGYKVERKPFTLTPATLALRLDTLFLSQDTLTLDEVLIAAERPPVVFRHDTIEFNAASFKTMPSALVEDLLRKLPGVRVDVDGNITVNGQAVSRVMVDGKAFFCDDPKVATRNLSANMIETVQVTEDKQQRDANPMATSSEVGMVLNLTLKKAIKKGWFGKGYAGTGGTEENPENPYEVGAIANLFRDTLQVSVLGAANNLNRAGFGFRDLREIGGFSRGGISQMNVMGTRSGTSSMSINGVDMGSSGNGLATSRNAGLNANYQAGKKLALNVRYLAGNTLFTSNQVLLRKQFLGDTALINSDTTRKQTSNLRQSAGMNLIWKPDTLTTFTFSPSALWGNDTDSTRIRTRLERQSPADTFRLNAFDNRQQMNGSTVQGALKTTLIRKFKLPKQQFSLSYTGNYTYTRYGTLIQANGLLLEVAAPTTNQLRQRNQGALNSNFSASYQHPLGKVLTGTISFSHEFNQRTDTVASFAPENIENPAAYTAAIDSLSSTLKQTYQATTVSGSVIWEHGSGRNKLALQPSLGVQWLANGIHYAEGPSVDQPFFNIVPGLTAKFRDLRINYNFNQENISMNDLIVVKDNRNPSSITLGNPGLQPSQYQRFMVSYFKANKAKNTSNQMWITSTVRQRAVVYARTIVPETGQQFRQPLNVNGVWNAALWAEHAQPLHLGDSITGTLTSSITSNVSRNIEILNSISTSPLRYSLDPQVALSLDVAQWLSLNPTYTFTWTLQDFNQEGRQAQQMSWHQLDAMATLRFGTRWSWENTLQYRYNPTPSAGFAQHSALLNSYVVWLFLKQNRGQLKLTAYDLLNQNRSISRTLSGAQEAYEENLLMRRYFMLTFLYDLRLKGAAPKNNRKSQQQQRGWWNW